MHPYSSIDTTDAWKKLRFILSVRSDILMNNSLSTAAHAFVSHGTILCCYRKYLVSFFKFIFLRLFRLIWGSISLVCFLKYWWNWPWDDLEKLKKKLLLFFSSNFFFSHFCYFSVSFYITIAIIGCWNWGGAFFRWVYLKSLYCCIYTIVNAGESPSYFCSLLLSFLRPRVWSSISLFFGLFFWVHSLFILRLV